MFNASGARSLAARLEVSYGTFYSGERLRVFPLIEWRPSHHFLLALEYDHNEVWLPEGDFRNRIARVRIDIGFNADLSWSTLVQYDNVDDAIAINTRLRWIIVPGRELFLVLNQDLNTANGVRRGATEPLVKLAWTLRF